jgi:hypothetical protein
MKGARVMLVSNDDALIGLESNNRTFGLPSDDGNGAMDGHLVSVARCDFAGGGLIEMPSRGFV